MKEQALIEQVENYLLNSSTDFVKNSIEYVGIRENHVISNEKPKDYYFLSYDAVVDENNQYSTKSYFVLIDKISQKISYILGPQSLEKIEDTE
ncbi:hypothetical protein PFY12_06030 [Chryseobacterium camelliae]|uniref:Immunity protein 35 domain-containing protein n=1 Tax=Chryseobacterium camelliae TaxID=1265445 RepID=A0ABY7QRU3_9FLAO|nr:hypothetical protein [Chryseobacterium camelliae]PZU09339.1 MAG: hypothetical protein DI622_16660 [Chryseobacterium sp.]WBV61677.1 hypothetical protein PFY12_06030 [Chryseobacterium camelliae]